MPKNAWDNTSIQAVPGIGARKAEYFARLGVHTLQDLLFHLPLRYEDRTRRTPIRQLRPGVRAVIEGEILKNDIAYGRRRKRSLACILGDDSGVVTLRFYHFNDTQRRMLREGGHLRCYGEVRQGRNGLELYHPEYTLLEPDQEPELERSLTPVYPSTEGISQYDWRRASKFALQGLQAGSLPDWLHGAPQFGGRQIGLEEALHYLHAPPADTPLTELQDDGHPYRQRLAFEELLAHYLGLRKLRGETRRTRAPGLPPAPEIQEKFLGSLGFQLTGAQRRVSREIARDLRGETPMMRLLQGDVGSGKTVVAALAALQSHAAGCQTALMAPTEILAEQHYRSFDRWCMPLGVPVAWLTGRIKGKKRQLELQRLASGEASIAIGTHALLQEDVRFARLGLAIIDEQHRFGVHQRLQLREKSGIGSPHQLIMTATPIPRTLAMTAYADLDVSRIDELPPGRLPVKTALVSDARRAEVIERLRLACMGGQQGYWVCTLIEESDVLQCQAAETTARELRARLPQLSVGLVHGRLSSQQKAEVMAEFNAQKIDLLVATTVVEVGVDVQNAGLMIIENPERLGLAQLHQLRGRVGRGERQSHCVLLYSTAIGEGGVDRLRVIRDHNDGFKIAEKDLDLRGPGEVLGARQTGLVEYRVANLRRDAGLLEAVRRYGDEFSQQHPQHVEALIRRWTGDAQQYAEV